MKIGPPPSSSKKFAKRKKLKNSNEIGNKKLIFFCTNSTLQGGLVTFTENIYPSVMAFAKIE